MKENSFISILSKVQVFNSPKWGRIGGNKIKFNEIFT